MSFRKLYGASAFHLLTLLAGFALFGYAVLTLGPERLWNPHIWWQSIAVWFAAAVIGHDLVVFPLYALADRALGAGSRLVPSRIPVVNHVRIPLLASILLLVVFLPGIIEQGAPAYRAATGLTQEPFLGRWLLLTAAMFGLSAALYAVRLLTSRRDVTPPPA
ncbi:MULTISPECIES: hypothetical protein [Mycobacteriaceae]|uniref:hypothetical protein n=1 Tax=Mycobacteriaceae TaxID=1762 RepID=UPI0008010B14|nr:MULTISPECIES: hypothetical protein [Mycobacteriaceae]MCK0175780.1 hypothetical protein [Mycolicibacterium sp. F2034L]OBB60138.1 hypothetical protein A5757_10740 [Mycobacterium sp. 852013-51886_SCH5428379]